MKEFNLDEYLKDPSQKVITKDGRKVRIICTDYKSDYKSWLYYNYKNRVGGVIYESRRYKCIV